MSSGACWHRYWLDDRHRKPGGQTREPRPAGCQFGGDKERLRSRSIWRRFFLVGRPAPVSQTSPDGRISRGGAGGLWSTMHSPAIEALTRVPMTRVTSSSRARPVKANTRSPHRTRLAGFAGAPLILTWPPLQASVARDRVLYTRTAQSQRSIRIWSTDAWCHRVPSLTGRRQHDVQAESLVPSASTAGASGELDARRAKAFSTSSRVTAGPGMPIGPLPASPFTKIAS